MGAHSRRHRVEKRHQRLVGRGDLRGNRHFVFRRDDAGTLERRQDSRGIAKRLVDEQIRDRPHRRIEHVARPRRALAARKSVRVGSVVVDARGIGNRNHHDARAGIGIDHHRAVLRAQWLGEFIVGSAPLGLTGKQMVETAVNVAQAPGKIIGGNGTARSEQRLGRVERVPGADALTERRVRLRDLDLLENELQIGPDVSDHCIPSTRALCAIRNSVPLMSEVESGSLPGNGPRHRLPRGRRNALRRLTAPHGSRPMMRIRQPM